MIDNADNPTPIYDTHYQLIGWTWYDETGCYDRIYPTYQEALTALLEYVAHLEGRQSKWQRFRQLLSQLWHDESTIPPRKKP